MSATAQYLALSRRSIVGTLRQPASVVPSLLFPLIFLALMSSTLNETIHLPGFPPVESFLQFVVATSIVQGALLGAVGAGADMATDVENGFFERIVASPVARTSLLAGRVAGAATLGFVQAWLFVGVATLFGLSVEGGIAAIAAIGVVAAVLSAGTGALMMAFGLRTGSAEAVQGAFPLLFVLLFFSSAFFPRPLMDGWFATVATWNPTSRLIEGLRHQVIAGLDAGQLLIATGVAAGLLVVGLLAAGVALRWRLAGAS